VEQESAENKAAGSEQRPTTPTTAAAPSRIAKPTWPGQRGTAHQAAGDRRRLRSRIANSDELAVAVVDGIVAIDRKLRQLLDSEGLTPIEAAGQMFDRISTKPSCR
jgi:hypothetical protein